MAEEETDLGGGQFYCRFFDNRNDETACSGEFSSEDACASAARAAGARGYAWTMKPCGQMVDSSEIKSA